MPFSIVLKLPARIVPRVPTAALTKETQRAPLGTKPNLTDTRLRKLFLKKTESKALGCPPSADTRSGRLCYHYLQAGFVRCGSPECHTCSQIPAGNNAGARQGKASSVPPSLRVNIKCLCRGGGREQRAGGQKGKSLQLRNVTVKLGHGYRVAGRIDPISLCWEAW